MNRPIPNAGNLTGTILVAHPNLRDPNFCRSLVFLAHHAADEGAMGFILNRPAGQTLGAVSGFLALGGFPAGAPVFEGGPVAPDDLIIVMLRWCAEESAAVFRGFGTAPEFEDIPPECAEGVRAFAGHAGWSRGQLESEIAEGAWLVVPPGPEFFSSEPPADLWGRALCGVNRIFRLYTDAPEDPSLN